MGTFMEKNGDATSFDTHSDKHALVYQITGNGLISIIKSSLWKYCYSN